VWTPARFTWANGAATVGLIPTRYPDTRPGVDDALLLARRTEWAAQGPLCGYGLGQRLLATDAGEYALMDVRTVTFDGDGERVDEGRADGEHG
jgi:type VI secretion system protein ImpE